MKVLACLAIGALGNIWSNCGTGSDVFQVGSLTLTPDPPVTGQQISVATSGQLSEQITGGQIVLDLRYDWVVPVKKTVDLCDTLKQIGKSCPLPAGPLSISVAQQIPGAIPRGKLSGTVTLKAQDGRRISCISLNGYLHSEHDAEIRAEFDALQKSESLPALTPLEKAMHWMHFFRHMYERRVENGAIADRAAEEFHDALPAVRSSMAEEIDQMGSSWKAETPDRFRDYSVKDAKQIMGSIIGEHAVLPPKANPPTENVQVPESFDSRKQWPACPTIGHIRDQSHCGSCWAHGSTEAFADRLAIASGCKKNLLLSTQHTTSCCGLMSCASMGCNGGHPGAAWLWFAWHGVVTGGDYSDIGKDDTCWPYEIAPSGEKNGFTTPTCRSSCLNTKYSNPFKQDYHKAAYSYMLPFQSWVKSNMYEHGPVTACYMVYSDFMHYKSGVYQHKTGNLLGGHAVKIVGWGQDEGLEYWTIANSWGNKWGEDGFFRIKTGDSGINNMISAGTVRSSAVETVVV